MKAPASEAGHVQVADAPDLREPLTHALTEKLKEHGWAPLAEVRSYIGKNVTSFDARNYGSTKLGELVRTLPYIEVGADPDASGMVHLYVRMADG